MSEHVSAVHKLKESPTVLRGGPIRRGDLANMKREKIPHVFKLPSGRQALVEARGWGKGRVQGGESRAGPPRRVKKHVTNEALANNSRPSLVGTRREILR